MSWTGWKIACAAFVGAATCGIALSCASFGSDDPSTPPPGDEASTSDGGNPAADGAPDGPGPSGPFCLAHPGAVLCDDFDDPGRAVWDVTSVDDGGVLALSDAGAVSPPNVLTVGMAPHTSTICRSAYEKATLDASAPNGFHLELQVRADALTDEVAVGPGVMMGNLGLEHCEYFLYLGPNGASLAQEHKAIGSTTTPVGRKLVAGWNTVTIDVEGVAPNRVVSVHINGATSTVEKQLVDPTCQQSDRIIGTNVGLFCISNAVLRNVQLSFDDVLVTAR